MLTIDMETKFLEKWLIIAFERTADNMAAALFVLLLLTPLPKL